MIRTATINALIMIITLLTVQAYCQPVSLEQAMRETCTNSDSVRMMKETLRKSEMMVKEKWASAYPKISTSLSASRLFGSLMGTSMGGSSGSSSSSTVGSTSLGKTAAAGASTDPSGDIASLLGGIFNTSQEMSYYSASLQVSQPIYTFGKVRTGIHVATDYDSSVQYNYRRNVQQLQLLGLDAYYQVVLSNMSLAIAQRSLTRKQELHTFLKRNFELGSGSKAQVLTTQADVRSQVTDIITAQQGLHTATMNLCVLMGRPLSDTITLDTASKLREDLLSISQDRNAAIESALTKRGDIRSIGFLRKVNEGGEKIYKAMYLPSIGASASLGTGGTDIKDIFNLPKRTWMVGVGLQWTLFDGYTNSSKAAQYHSDANKLAIVGETMVKMVTIEIDAALAECAAADSNVAALKEMLAATQESYDLTEDNFKQGSGQFAELQLSEERLRQCEMGMVQAYYRQVRSRAALTIAMGNDCIHKEEQ